MANRNGLEEAIERLYAAFAEVPPPKTISACPCCVPEEEVRQLLAVSKVRAVPPDLLASYASSAFLTAGSVADYLYFLPRILHISATDDAWWPDPEITGRAIQASEPESWSADQRSAVDLFFSAVIRASLELDQHHRLDPWMCAIAKSGFAVRSRLSIIQESREAVLAYFIEHAGKIPQRKLSNEFWDLPSDAHDAIVDWFYSEPIRTILADEYGYILPEAT